MRKIEITTPLEVNNVTFQNRILRSSVGGRLATYDGTVTDVWKNFEKRFADGGVGGIISTTFHVNHDRLSPMQYPSIANKEKVPYLKKFIREIKRDRPSCKYIIQIGDPGYVTYESLFPDDEQDGLSSSDGFDLVFGYTNRRKEMTQKQIDDAIEDHVLAAGRVKEAGADGVEIAAAKGYLIHQFLNPAFNFRKDHWGGSPDARFRFLEQIVKGVRDKVGRDFLVGIRLAAADHNLSPPAFALMRWPSPLLSRERRIGNDENQMIAYAKKLRACGVDYLHVVSGFGFPSPRETPGDFPFEEAKMFFHATHHLTFKTRVRSTSLTVIPKFIIRRWLGLGWKYQEALNRDAAKRFKDEVPGVCIIVNGGFRERGKIEEALESGAADIVSMARALLATPNLEELLSLPKDSKQHCSGCNKCVGRTATSPLGCYDVERFGFDFRKMHAQIMGWNQPDRVEPILELGAGALESTSPPLHIIGSSIAPVRPDAG
jgi:2,4-dienoyl-CoA reductase-like NADH-dependent reductase (Old Yellow Enzyme family)